MMFRVVPIVERHGEVTALSILLRRLRDWLTPDRYTEVQKPTRVHRDRFLNKDKEFLKYLELASTKARNNGWILILLDADDDCPAELGPTIVDRARGIKPHCRMAVVLPKREYESLVSGERGLPRWQAWIRAERAHHP